MDEKQKTRESILDAAMQRIKHYGYAKTTMSEIAADCCMSAGNIYRFFESKADIAEAMARRHYAHENFELGAIARQRDVPADERLRQIFFKRMRDNYCLVEENAKILEVAEVMKKERPLFMNEQFAQERVYLSALLEEGVSAGLFRDMDTMFAAEMLQVATIKFGFPGLVSALSLQKLERELDGVLTLVLTGLYHPDRHTAPLRDPGRAETTAPRRSVSAEQ